MNTIKLKSMLEQFYIEDIGDGDLSSDFLFPETAMGEMNLIAKMDGIFCGKKVIQDGLTCRGSSANGSLVMWKTEIRLKKGTIIATANGSVRSLLKSERVILNLIQRMSGIATETNRVVQRIKGTSTKVCRHTKNDARLAHA